MPITRNADGSPAEYVLGRSIMKDGGGPYEMLAGGTGGKLIWTLAAERALAFSHQGAELMLTEIGRPSGVMLLPLREKR